MAPSPTLEYRVTINDWNVNSIRIQAPSEIEAIEIAERMFDAEGPENFNWVASGQDDAIADLIEEVQQ